MLDTNSSVAATNSQWPAPLPITGSEPPVLSWILSAYFTGIGSESP